MCVCVQAFVGVVKKDVMAMEESVSKAETELSSGTLIKKLSSLVSSVRSVLCIFFFCITCQLKSLHHWLLSASCPLIRKKKKKKDLVYFCFCFATAAQNFDAQ